MYVLDDSTEHTVTGFTAPETELPITKDSPVLVYIRLLKKKFWCMLIIMVTIGWQDVKCLSMVHTNCISAKII